MKTIWKFPFQIDDSFKVTMPYGAEILTVQTQGIGMLGQELPHMWAIVDPEAHKVARWFRILGTGHDVPNDVVLRYIGTFQMAEGRLIWHLFEENPSYEEPWETAIDNLRKELK